MSRSPSRGAGRTQKFGNRDTAKKQGVVVSYLAAYLRVMSKQRFHLSYVDAFAGCGARIDAAESETLQTGFTFESPAPKPKVGTALDRYVFGDLNGRHLKALAERIADLGASGEEIPETQLLKADANELVQRECEWLAGHPMRRAVMFLDPYGMQVEWRTLEVIAGCMKIDLWLLLPTGIAVNRILPWKRAQHPFWAERMDAFYGSTGWRDALLTTDRDLLGVERQARSSDLSGIVRFTMSRLETLFGDGLYPHALALRTGRHQSYHLVFAASSKDKNARNIAKGIAGHLMRKAQAGS
jgi:three-Cys-motif partner protein